MCEVSHHKNIGESVPSNENSRNVITAATELETLEKNKLKNQKQTMSDGYTAFRHVFNIDTAFRHAAFGYTV